jgi:hypothetical protein
LPKKASGDKFPVYSNAMMGLDAKKRLLQTLHEDYGHVGYDTLINAIRRNVIVTETPNSFDNILLFPEKEAKSVSSASQKVRPYPKLGEADPGGFGGRAPKKHLIRLIIFFFF